MNEKSDPRRLELLKVELKALKAAIVLPEKDKY